MDGSRSYRVTFTDREMSPDGRWDRDAWRGTLALCLDSFMGEKPSHMPFAQARLLAGPEALSVIFRVEDRWVRAMVRGYQGPVWTDSCVEFFFTPGASLSEGYFNIEVNCGGAVLFQHQQARDRERVLVGEMDAARLRVSHSLPERVDPEIVDPVTWTVEYQVPYEVLAKYAPVAKPASGVSWRANFYKCGDATSHPHWLTWSPVGWPTPDFHRPEFFGTLLFG